MIPQSQPWLTPNRLISGRESFAASAYRLTLTSLYCKATFVYRFMTAHEKGATQSNDDRAALFFILDLSD